MGGAYYPRMCLPGKHFVNSLVKPSMYIVKPSQVTITYSSSPILVRLTQYLVCIAQYLVTTAQHSVLNLKHLERWFKSSINSTTGQHNSNSQLCLASRCRETVKPAFRSKRRGRVRELGLPRLPVDLQRGDGVRAERQCRRQAGALLGGEGSFALAPARSSAWLSL